MKETFLGFHLPDSLVATLRAIKAGYRIKGQFKSIRSMCFEALDAYVQRQPQSNYAQLGRGAPKVKRKTCKPKVQAKPRSKAKSKTKANTKPLRPTVKEMAARGTLLTKLRKAALKPKPRSCKSYMKKHQAKRPVPAALAAAEEKAA